MGSALRYGDGTMIPQTILFPTDFSGRCDRARDRAVQLAGQWGARLVLFHVLNEPDAAALADERRKYEAAAHDRLKAEVQDKTIAVETRLASGSVAQAILDAADQCAADLIVTGISRHDDIGDFIVGTTVERVIRQAHQPVLVVKERVEQHYSRLMVATDFSDCSALALCTAAAVCFQPLKLHWYTPIRFGWRRYAAGKPPLRHNRPRSRLNWKPSSTKSTCPRPRACNWTSMSIMARFVRSPEITQDIAGLTWRSSEHMGGQRWRQQFWEAPHAPFLAVSTAMFCSYASP